MARRIVSVPTIATITAAADTAGLTNNQYPFVMKGGSTSQMNYIWEVSISGQAATNSSPTYMILGLDSTLGATPGSDTAGLMDTPNNPVTAALAAPTASHNAFTTAPQRSSAAHLANCSLNAFGGNYFWRANRMEEAFVMVGNAVVSAGLGGEISLSAFTGGTPGAVGAHMIYESL